MRPFIPILIFLSTTLLSFPGITPLVLSSPTLVGRDVQEGGLDTTCRILTRNSQGKLLGVCSGTLTHSQEIRTAAHCVDFTDEEDVRHTVQCGYSGQSGHSKIETLPNGFPVQTEGLKFKAIRTANEIFIHRRYPKTLDSDKAVATFFPKIDPELIAPAKTIPKSKITEYLKEESECRIEGYGIGNDGITGVLHHAPKKAPFEIENLQLKKAESHEDVRFFQNRPLVSPTDREEWIGKSISSLGVSGDSGGPLYCRKNAKSSWRLLGTAAHLMMRQTEDTNFWNLN
jgi:hypothetical protein